MYGPSIKHNVTVLSALKVWLGQNQQDTVAYHSFLSSEPHLHLCRKQGVS